MDHATALDGHPAVVHSKIIRNFAVVGYLEYGNVRLFANLQRANLPLAPERISSIPDGNRIPAAAWPPSRIFPARECRSCSHVRDDRSSPHAKELPIALRRFAKAARHGCAGPVPIAAPPAARAWTPPH